MAHGAGLVLLRLVMESRNRRRSGVNRESVTFQAEEIDLATLEKPGICRAMRRMARGAAFDFDGFMLVDEGTGLVGMALEANGVLS